MAKVAVTVAVFLTLFVSTFARFPSNFQSNLELPSSEIQIDRSGSDDVQSNPQIASLRSSEDVTESNVDGRESDLPDLNAETDVLSIPVTVITFRPVNRHFLPFPFHHSRHHHQAFHRAMKPWRPYGDDMIMAGEDRGFESRPIRGGDHRMTEEWIGLDQYPHHHHHHHHHHEDARPRFPHMHHDGMMLTGRIGLEDRVQEHGGPVKKFRKFLNQFGF